MTNRWTGVVMIAGLGLAGALSLPRAHLSAVLSEGFSDGATQAALQSEVEDTLAYREGAIVAWTSLRYALFGETPKGAVPGRGEWLFTDEEYQFSPDSAQIMDQRLAQVVETAQRLDADGIHLTVALLPDKSRIYSDYLRHPRPPAVLGPHLNHRHRPPFPNFTIFRRTPPGRSIYFGR